MFAVVFGAMAAAAPAPPALAGYPSHRLERMTHTLDFCKKQQPLSRQVMDKHPVSGLRGATSVGLSEA